MVEEGRATSAGPGRGRGHAKGGVPALRARHRWSSDLGTLEAILEGAHTHLAYLDRDFRFICVNSTYARGAGYSREELIGRYHFDLFPNAENQAIFEQVRATGKPASYRAKPFTYPDQPERGVTYWDWTLSPVPDQHGNPATFVFSLLEVTEQVEARAQLNRANADLRHLNRELTDRLDELRRLEQAKAEHLQVLAHELRNPLAAALGLAQLIRLRLDRADPGPGPGRAAHAEAAELLRLADAELQRLSRLSADLLTAYRVSSGRLPLDLRLINFAQVVDQALAPYRQGLAERTLVEDRLAPPELPVMGDHGRLIEVLTNLLANSIKYSPPGSTIALRTRVEEGVILVEVEDQGIGIPPGELESVFEGFRRGSNAGEHGPGGVGLGLYISRDIVRRHGGELWASHRRGGGTVMHLRLPLAQPI